jgi:hypothetical protein
MRVLQGGEREREGKRVWQSGLEKRCSWESDIGREKKVRRSGERRERDKDRLLRHDILVPSKSGLSC